MGTCRCSTTKQYPAARLYKLERTAREELGQGRNINIGGFDKFTDSFRIVSFTSKGTLLSGCGESASLNAKELPTPILTRISSPLGMSRQSYTHASHRWLAIPKLWRSVR
ncbi:MAG: hypothetical protein GX307_03170 [Euryarchaeota archaeon]|jgi:hypothetical protein|nr:hypothetical protein [Euryarchaeota archaeon]